MMLSIKFGLTNRGQCYVLGIKGRGLQLITQVTTLIIVCSMFAACLGDAASEETSFVYGDQVLSYEQVSRGEPGLIVEGATDTVISDGKGILIHRISSLAELGISRDTLHAGGLSAFWGTPKESGDWWELYYLQEAVVDDEILGKRNIVTALYAEERMYKLLAERDVNVDDLLSSNPYVSRSEFKFGDVPLFGPYWAMREVLGPPSAFLRESDYSEMPVIVQWTFLVDERPEAIILVFYAVFTKGLLRSVRVLIAYEKEQTQ